MLGTAAHHPSLLASEDNAVPDALVGRLYRAGVGGAAAIAREFSPHQRANLAAYCYRKAHLHGIGLAIAACCERTALVQALGSAFGTALYTQSRAPAPPAARPPGPHRPAVTLARADRPDASQATLVPEIGEEGDDQDADGAYAEAADDADDFAGADAFDGEVREADRSEAAIDADNSAALV